MYDTGEKPEEGENVSAQESSQEVGGNNRELNFLFMALRTRSGRIIRTSQLGLFCGNKRLSLTAQLVSCSQLSEIPKFLSVTRENASF